MRLCRKLVAFLILGVLSANIYASGTYVAPPPKKRPKKVKVDCSKEENKEKKECQ